MAQKKLSKTRQEINRQYEENELADLKQRQTRARSVSVGNAGGGVIEINMRGDFANLWFQMNPTEAVEFIGQLASSCGVEIAMRPRNDFASWRGWDTSLPPTVHWLGTAPWQLTEEERALLAESKGQNVKNIKAINASNESESESE